MLNLENVTLNFKDKKVLDSVNLAIKDGETTCLLGESGAGKTSILNIIAGLQEYNGKITNTFDKVSYVFQTPRLIEDYTIMENLKFAVENLDINKTIEVLEMLKISTLKDKVVKNLSGGEKQRVNLGRAILFDAKLMLFDEPLSSLDIGLRHKILYSLKEFIVKNNKTCLFVSHDIEETITLADNIAILKNEKIYMIENAKFKKNLKEIIYKELEVGNFS